MSILETQSLVRQLQQIREFELRIGKIVYDFCTSPHQQREFYVLLLNRLIGGPKATGIDISKDYRWDTYMKFFKLQFLKSPIDVRDKKNAKTFLKYQTPGYDDSVDMYLDEGEGITVSLGVAENLLGGSTNSLSVRYAMKVEERYDSSSKIAVLDLIHPVLFEDNLSTKRLEEEFEIWVRFNFHEEIEEVKTKVLEKKEQDKKLKAEKAAKDAERERAEYLRLKEKFERDNNV